MKLLGFINKALDLIMKFTGTYFGLDRFLYKSIRYIRLSYVLFNFQSVLNFLTFQAACQISKEFD